MKHRETELEQAERLNAIIDNVSSDERGMFDGVHARRLSRTMMDLIDMAVFILPASKTACDDGESYDRFKERVLSGVCRTAVPQSVRGADRKSGWVRLVGSLMGVGVAIAAFCLALLVDPVPTGSHEGRSIDTFGQPWYNSQMVNYTLTSAAGDNGSSSYYVGFHDAGSGFRAFVYK